MKNIRIKFVHRKINQIEIVFKNLYDDFKIYRQL